VQLKATRKDLIGRKIVAVNLRSFPDGKGGTATDPLLTLDNGRRIWFVVDETEVGEYGVCICIAGKEKT
jgi:hypothetical protein